MTMTMNRIRALARSAAIGTLVMLCCQSLHSQHWVNPNFECHRLDLRDLGYPEVNQVPANSSAITSLLVAASGKIYGGTTGEEAYLFLYDSAINKVKHLGKIKGQHGIHHALVQDEGFIYAGTGLNVFRQLELTANFPNARDSVSDALWLDIRKQYASYAGGHLYRYDPVDERVATPTTFATGDDYKQVAMPNDFCPVEDLGAPVASNGIYALAVDARAHTIYGISYPDGHLFAYNIPQKQVRDLGEIDHRVVFHGPERDWRSLPRALFVDESGKVYTSGDEGFLVYYDPAEDKVRSTGLKVPGEYYPVQGYVGHPVVECFAAGEQHLVYGGSSDGHLFSFNTATRTLTDLGKPRASRRLRALTVGKNGRVYMMAGERFEPCRLFSFDPKGGGFRDLGVMAVDRSPYYSWRGQQFDSMVTGLDGTIYIGESERRSHLFVYLP